MAKRIGLQVTRRASTALVAAAKAKDSPTSAGESRGGIRTAGISLPSDVWELLTDVAVKRKKTRGGRASLSAIVLELVEKHRAELEAEIAG